MGGSWRLPTKEEMTELTEACTWEWVEMEGRKGYMGTAKNGNTVFLPVAGLKNGDSLHDEDRRASFWTSTPDAEDNRRAYTMDFSHYASIIIPPVVTEATSNRYAGLSVRAVSE